MLENTEYASIKLLKSVKSMTGVPRFGHSKQFIHFFAEDTALRKDYTHGIFLAFTMMMIIGAVWFFGLIILRLLGHRVGCAAGKPATIPAEPMGDKTGSINTNETGEFIVMQADQNRVNRTRIVFFCSVLYCLAACGVLLYCFIMVQNSTQEFYEYTVDAKSAYESVPENWATMVEKSTQFEVVKNELMSNLETFCPSDTAGTVGGEDASRMTTNYKDSLELIPDFSMNIDWIEFNASLTDVNDVLASAVDFFKFIDGPSQPWYWGSLLSIGILTSLTIYLLGSAWTAGREGYEFVGEAEVNSHTNFLDYVGIPLFAALIAGSWFVTSVALSVIAGNADFCYDEITNGDTMLNIINERGYNENTSVYRLADDYLHGCIGGNFIHFDFIDEDKSIFENAKVMSTMFTSLDPAELDSACDGDAVAMLSKAIAVTAELTDLASNYEVIYSHLSCQYLAPIVQKAVFENSCQSMSTGFIWIFASALSLATFGSIMLSLRSATSRPQIYLVPAGQNENDSYIIDDESY